MVLSLPIPALLNYFDTVEEEETKEIKERKKEAKTKILNYLYLQLTHYYSIFHALWNCC